MENAGHVGRVGTLAAALGIGFAVATTPGMAWGDAGDAGSDAANLPAESPAAVSKTGTGPVATPLADTQPGETAVAGARPAIASVIARAVGFPTPTSQRIHHLGRPSSAPRVVNGTGDAQTSADSTSEDSPPIDDPSVVPHRNTRGTPSLTTSSAVHDTLTVIAESRSTSRHSLLANTNADTVATVSDATPARPVITAPVTLSAPKPASRVGALPAVFLNAAAGLIDAILSPSALPGAPTRPADPPLLWGVLAFVRRQFINTTPTLKPTPTHTDPTTGLVSGSLGGADADGDPITYRVVSDPAHGAIKLDQTTGDYVYTPRAGYAGTDTFVVSVTDTGPDGLFDFLRPARGHTSAASLTITIDPSVTVTVDPVADPTGAAAVTGRIETTGPNPLSYTVSTPPGRGQITVHTDGTFAYVPNPVDRVRANATTTLDDDVDSFTVTITDGGIPLTAVVVTVPVSPTASALTYRIPADQTPVSGVVLDPTSHTIYQTTESRDATGTYTTHIAIVTHGQNATVIDLTGTRPADGVVVDPTTHTAYQTSYDRHADGTNTTLVTAITANGSATVATLPGEPIGGVVLDPSTHTAYQLTQTEAAAGKPITVVTAITSAGTQTAASLPGDAGGRLVLDQGTHTIYLTTNVFDSVSGTYIATQVTAIAPAGTTGVATLAGEQPVGEVILDPTTHTIYQTTQFQNPVTGANGIHVTAITSDGIRTAATIRGRADSGAVLDATTGSVYQTSYGQNGDGSFTTQVTRISGTGTNVSELSGAPVGPLVLDPITGTAYQTTEFRNSVTGADGGHVTAIASDGTITVAATLRGRPVGGVVLDRVTGSVYQTVVGTDSAQVVRVGPSGTTATPLVGYPVGGVVIDAATGTAYQTTTSGVYVVGVAPVTSSPYVSAASV